MGIPSEEFARTLGDALQQFLAKEGISQAKASRTLEMGKATLNTYCHDAPTPKNKKKKSRPLANAEVLVKACVQLGFEFDYGGHRIMAVPTAAHQNGNDNVPKLSEQLPLEFDSQINLTSGTLSISVKRPAGRVEMSVSVKSIVS